MNINERYYKLCSNKQVEDGLHLICVYTLYDPLHNILYYNIILKCDVFREINDEEPLCYMLTEEWKETTFLDQALFLIA